MKSVKHVEGRDVGHISLYTLSTCVWCKMTKKLLNELGVAYDYVDVDRIDGDEKETVMEEVKKAFSPAINSSSAPSAPA